MGNRLFRVVYWKGINHDGVALIYAEDEAEAAMIHAQQRNNSILSVTAMRGGFIPGTYVNGGLAERAYLPAHEMKAQEMKVQEMKVQKE